MSSYGPPPVPAPGPTYWAPFPRTHPAAPEPVETGPRRATSAVWALVLAVIGVSLAACFGGAVAAVAAIILARSAQTEIAAAHGWLTGTRMARWALILGWIGLAAAAAILALTLTGWLLAGAGPTPDPHYPSNVN